MLNPEDRFKNQSGIIRPQTIGQLEFTIIGAGAIGSFFAMSLAKMGARRIKIYDGDTIEDHNIANQFYPEQALREKKVEALTQVVGQFAGVAIETVDRHWTPTDGVSGIVISCVDNMAVRRQIYDAAKGSGLKFIDGRMGAQLMRVYTIDTANESHCSFYESNLYTDGQAVQERCTQRSIIYTVFLVSGIMLNQVKKLINHESYCPEVMFDAVTDLCVATRNVAPKPE